MCISSIGSSSYIHDGSYGYTFVLVAMVTIAMVTYVLVAMVTHILVPMVTCTYSSAYDKGRKVSGHLFSYRKFIDFPIDDV